MSTRTKKLASCPRCGIANPSEAKTCHACQEPLPRPAPRAGEPFRGVSGVAVVPGIELQPVVPGMPGFVLATAPARPGSGGRTVAWLSCDPLPPIPVGPSPVVTLGRGHECDLVLPHASVSRTHAIVHVSGSALELEDCSSFGTFVNGARVQRACLEPGDTIAIGPYEIEILAREATARPALDGETSPVGEPLRDPRLHEGPSGAIEGEGLAAVLRELERDRRTGTLGVSSGVRAGQLVLEAGAPLWARLGALEGELAIHALVALRDGSYEFRSALAPGVRNVSLSLGEILRDATRDDDDH